MEQTILVALSSHGFGHLGQITPIIRGLKAIRPDIKWVVRSQLPKFKLLEKLGTDIEIQSAFLDIGMVQKNALTIDFDQTALKYKQFHSQWDNRLNAEIDALRSINPDLVLVNIPYLTLAAAQKLDIPNIAYCSLNWAELYQEFFKENPEAQCITQQMLSAYNQASCFIQPAPAMNMPGITNGVPIGPVAQIGNNIREQLNQQIGILSSDILVLVSLGGMQLTTHCNDWPRFPNMRLLVPESWESKHPDTLALESLGHSFSDLMASSNALICKPGYGSFVEAACCGTPVLYLPRAKWTESEILIDWLNGFQTCMELSHSKFEEGNFHAEIETLIREKRKTTPVASGIQQAITKICTLL